MKQYHQVISDILKFGTRQANRTGTDAITLPGAFMRFDLEEGFPAITTKQLFFKKGFAEMVGFLRGLDNAQDFADIGCDWWFKDANENSQWLASPYRKGTNDLGRIYGKQWRDWRCADGSSIDQLQVVLDTIRKNPTSRRIIMQAWRPDEFDQMALPPCHVAYEFMVNVERQELNMTMWQRSCDMALGVPMNIATSALLLHMVAEATGLKPKYFTHFLSDAHIYVNHVDGLYEQLEREPYELPSLFFDMAANLYGNDANQMAALDPSMIRLVGYKHHPAIKFEMVTG